MVRLAWVTDPHLNFADFGRWSRFVDELRHQSPDLVVVTGDISEADDLIFQLGRLHSALNCPIYFVLGNHDFYGGSIRMVRQIVQAWCEGQSIHYLTASDVMCIGRDWAIVGHDGWADGRSGDYTNSPVDMTDFHRIDDFVSLDRTERRSIMEKLAEESTVFLEHRLEEAVGLRSKVLICTHVPPFRDACLYEGEKANADWAPYFVNEQLGAMLQSIAKRYPNHSFRVLCGHSHSRAYLQVAQNLEVFVGEAIYRQPEIEQVWEL